MRPKSSSVPTTADLFRSHLNQILNTEHPLCRLARQVDWKTMEKQLAECYCDDFGAPAKSTRLMVGLHYLKHMFDESDESLVERWVENPYWQYFCGYEYMQHEFPIHPTTLVKWRQRVGDKRIEALLSESVRLAVRQKKITPHQLSKVTVDTTVQEKAVAYPTDARLLYKAARRLAKLAVEGGITLRQSYVRVTKKHLAQQGRYARARQYKRAGRHTRKLKTILGRLLRDIRRKAARQKIELTQTMKTMLGRASKIHAQKRTDTNKLYSIDAPEVACISKGKAHKKFEFGCKVALTLTNRGNWILGVRRFDGNPHDSKTLAETMACSQRITGVETTDIFADKGYRGNDYTGEAEVHISGKRSRANTRDTRRRRKRRNAIEPKISHLKQDNRMGRCYLKGAIGDQINAVLAAAGANLLKMLRLIGEDIFVSLYNLRYIRQQIILFMSPPRSGRMRRLAG